MTTPPAADLEAMQREVDALRRAAIEAHRRRRLIRVMRWLIAAGVVVIVVTAFALGVALVASGI